jgi:hypothetical protein
MQEEWRRLSGRPAGADWRNHGLGLGVSVLVSTLDGIGAVGIAVAF